MRIVEIEDKKIALAFLALFKLAIEANVAGKLDAETARLLNEGKQVFKTIAELSSVGFQLVLVKAENCDPSQN
jgi:hypothetical protein